METILITDITLLAPVFGGGEFMPSDYAIFYKTLAEGMDDMLISINSNLDAIDKNRELLTYMLNLTTNEDFDVNSALADIRTVLNQDVYEGLNVFPGSKPVVALGTYATNEHTKRYITNDLTDFVNNEVWPGDCVPYEWAIASENTGEDISGWNVCDPS
jgi:hypothetical protein